MFHVKHGRKSVFTANSRIFSPHNPLFMRFLQKIVTFTTFHVKHLIRGGLKGYVKEKLQIFWKDRDGFLQKRAKKHVVLCFT